MAQIEDIFEKQDVLDTKFNKVMLHIMRAHLLVMECDGSALKI